MHFFSNYFTLMRLGLSGRSVEKVFQNIIKNRTDTLIKLDKYDTGKIKKSRDLAQYSSVRDYLREVQKSSN